MANHKEIWLGPDCQDCGEDGEDYSTEDRLWCQDDIFETCDECGKGSVRYVRADLHDVLAAKLADEKKRCEEWISNYIEVSREAEDAMQKQRDDALAKLAEARRLLEAWMGHSEHRHLTFQEFNQLVWDSQDFVDSTFAADKGDNDE